jgi:hypothetical protein
MIKKILIYTTLLFPGVAAFSQEPADAIRYSWLQPGGTARIQAVGGASVGLGGEITTAFTNPAGLGLYKTSEFVFTGGFQFANVKGDYLNNNSKESKSAGQIGTTGFVLALPTKSQGAIRNWTFGIAANRKADFNNSISYSGLNNESSYSEKYLEELIRENVTDPNDAANNYPYGSSLAFNTFLIDTISSGNQVVGYRSNATPSSGLIQDQFIDTKGSMIEYTFATALNLSDKFYLGLGLGYESIYYVKNSTYTESDATAQKNNFNYFEVEEYLKTTGTGFNVKLGLLFKPVEQFRIGLNIHTPTWYEMDDTYSTTMTTDVEGYAGTSNALTQSSMDFNGGLPGQYNYNYSTPWRFMGGLSYVLREVHDITKQKGFITAEVEYLNYTDNKYSANDNMSVPYFDELNGIMDNVFKSSFNFRLGGELKFKTWMVRAGYAYYGNPYTDAFFDDNPEYTDTGNKMNISGGLGWRDKGMFIDLTYVHRLTKDFAYPYRLDQGFFAPADLKGSGGNVLLTFGVKF